MKTISELILEAKEILSHAKTIDIGFGTPAEILDDGSLKVLDEWFLQVKLQLSNSPLWDEIEANSWIINGNRISRVRIEKIVSILELIKESETGN